MTTSTSFNLQDTNRFLAFDNLAQQSQHLASTVAAILAQEIAQNGTASLAVSGGSTPKAMFDALSQIDIPWSKVIITLVDDRWVSPSLQESNQRLVEDHLLQNNAANASFIGLFQHDLACEEAVNVVNQAFKSLTLPFDVVLLGMGNDGHTASIFPCSEQIKQAFSTTNTYLYTQPNTAPYQRISMSANTIKNAKHLFLQLKGIEKKTTLENALANTNEQEMPIRYFLNNKITVLWCP